MNNKIIVYGASGHALVVADIIRQAGKYEVVGFIDDVNTQSHGNEFCGASILGGKEKLSELLKSGVTYIVVAIGDCTIREKISGFVKDIGFNLATCIHPSAVIAADVSIGEGTVISAGVVVCAGAKIGESVIVNTAASIDHECIIGNAVHIGPGVRLGGLVTVGEKSWIGIGAVVIDRVKIGKSTIIGAGAVLLKSIGDGVVAYGVPAKHIRSKDI